MVAQKIAPKYGHRTQPSASETRTTSSKNALSWSEWVSGMSALTRTSAGSFSPRVGKQLHVDPLSAGARRVRPRAACAHNEAGWTADPQTATQRERR